MLRRALKKARGRRYETASAFAADVQRYLADEPVQAGPPGTGYRLRKFLKRHRGPVLAGAGVPLGPGGGVRGKRVGVVGKPDPGGASPRGPSGPGAKTGGPRRSTGTRPGGGRTRENAPA